jgi:predicted NAD/FAD-dependent oxidoreductase
VRTGVLVASMTRDGARWTVTDANGGTHTADIVVLATPAPQAVTLLGTSSDMADVAATLASVRMLPCWSTMVVFDAPPSAAVAASLRDGLAESDDPIVHRAWRQSVRPGRLRDEAWVVHSEGAWSAEHL